MDDFPRPDGVAEWIGTVVGVLVGVSLGAIGAAALFALVSALMGLVVLPAVIFADEPWWWAWVIGAGATIGMLLLAGVAIAVGHLESRKVAEPLERRGTFWRAAAWVLDHSPFKHRWAYAAFVAALLVYSVVTAEVWLAVTALVLLSLEALGLSARLVASRTRPRNPHDT